MSHLRHKLKCGSAPAHPSDTKFTGTHVTASQSHNDCLTGLSLGHLFSLDSDACESHQMLVIVISDGCDSSQHSFRAVQCLVPV